MISEQQLAERKLHQAQFSDSQLQSIKKKTVKQPDPIHTSARREAINHLTKHADFIICTFSVRNIIILCHTIKILEALPPQYPFPSI